LFKFSGTVELGSGQLQKELANRQISIESYKEKHYFGTPSEVALLRYADQLVPVEQLRHANQVCIDIISNCYSYLDNF
jgi:hypothetical protein